MSVVLTEPITGPAAWKGRDLAGDTSWTHKLKIPNARTLAPDFPGHNGFPAPAAA